MKAIHLFWRKIFMSQCLDVTLLYCKRDNDSSGNNDDDDDDNNNNNNNNNRIPDRFKRQCA